MKLLSVIVNYKTSDLIIDTIRALLQETKVITEAKIVVVDNDSQDGSYEFLVNYIIEQNWQQFVEIYQSPVNGGFGFGNNFAIRKFLNSSSSPEYVYLINPDAVPKPDAVSHLLELMEKEQKIGIVGSSVVNAAGEKEVAAFRYPNVISEFTRGAQIGTINKILNPWRVAMGVLDQTCEVDWVTGSSMMIRSQALNDIGLFDEKFFLYFEETDLCWRARLSGWKVFHHQVSSIMHIEGAATGIDNKEKRTPKYLFDSRKHYFKKNHGIFYLWMTNFAFLAGYFIRLIKQLLEKKESRRTPNYLGDFLKNSF